MSYRRYAEILPRWLAVAVLFIALVAQGQSERENPRAQREWNYRRDASVARSEAPESIVIPRVGRAAMGYPRIFTRVFLDRVMGTAPAASDVVQQARTLQGDWVDLNLAEGFGPQSWWTSVLDTGAGGYSVNQETAQRFGLESTLNAVFFVNGVDGTVNKGVSAPLTVNIAGSDGRLYETPTRPFVFVQDFAQFGIELQPYNPMYGVLPSGMNLVGMQAIRRLTFEVDSTGMDLERIAQPLDLSGAAPLDESLKSVIAGPTVRIFPTNYRPTNNLAVIPMQYVSFLQLSGGSDGGSVPNQMSTPVIQGAKTSKGERQFIGDFLFDTGSPYTIISRRQAYQLGLIESANPAFDTPEFRDAVTGIAGRTLTLPGFTLDSLAVRNPAGEIIEWRKVPVLVHDVWVQRPDGQRGIRDGIIGNNLFLPSTNGEIVAGGKLEVIPAPFPRFWIHGPSAQLWIERPAAVEAAGGEDEPTE